MGKRMLESGRQTAQAMRTALAESRDVFCVAFLAGLLVHALFYLKGLMNPDGLWLGEYFVAGKREISLGRWMLPILDRLHGGLNSSLLMGVLSLAFFALAAACLARIFAVQGRAARVLLALAVICTPFVANCLTYPYCTEAYSLAFLLAVAAVWLMTSLLNPVWGAVLGGGCLLLALGVYQTNIGVFAGALLGWCLVQLLRGTRPVRATWLVFGRAVGGAACAMVLYRLLMLAGGLVAGTGISDYRGADAVSLGAMVKQLPADLVNCYADFGRYLAGTQITSNAYGLAVWKVGLLGLAVVAVGLRCWQLHKAPAALGALAMAALLPIGCCAINLLVPGNRIELVMSGGLAIVMPLCVAVLLGELPQGVLGWLGRTGAVLTAVLVVGGTLLVYTDGMVMENTQRQAVALANRLWQDVEHTPGYRPGETEILFAGTPEAGNYPCPLDIYEKTDPYVKWGLFWETYNGCTKDWIQVYKQYLGVEYNWCSVEKFEQLAQADAFIAMPIYPEEGSVATIDGVLVIKISDTTGWV